MAYLDALSESKRQSRLRDLVIAVLLVCVVVLAVGWQAKQNEITVHIRPGLQSAVTARANEMPAENVFNFALTLMLQIYRWRTDARTEYPANVNGLFPYMTEKCRTLLLDDAKTRDRLGELTERTRLWEAMTGSYFTPSRVQVVDGRTWLVTLDAQIRETVRGETVKDGFFRYEVYVETTGGDRSDNPYGLLFNCFAPNSPSRLEPAAPTEELAQ